MSQTDTRDKTNRYADDGISLRPIFDVLMRYRHVMGAVVTAVTALFGLATITALIVLPKERVGTIQFRLLFEGADKNEYPNGATFSPTEIIAAPVLTEVYRANNLQRFMTYDNFKKSLFILSSNPDIDLLTYEYQSKLADPRLTPVDRSRLEDEFRRKRETLTDPVYSLNLRHHPRVTALPTALMQKVLNDTMATWASHADERKGATPYDVPVLSKNILHRETIEQEDYLVAVDILRAKTNRVIETIDRLAELPGAHVIRTGNEHVSLAEVRANLEDVVRFKLEPLVDLVRSEGVTKNGRALSLYANNQLFQLRMEREKSESLIRALQDSLGAYMAQGVRRTLDRAGKESGAAPSSGPERVEPSFLDRMMTLPIATQDQAYRQSLTDRIIAESERAVTLQREAAFYQDVVSNIQQVQSRSSGTQEIAKVIDGRTREAFDLISKAVEQLSELYRELSVRNLNPSTTLYVITGPFLFRAAHPLTMRAFSLYFFLVLAATLILTPIVCLLHHFFRMRAAMKPVVAS